MKFHVKPLYLVLALTYVYVILFRHSIGVLFGGVIANALVLLPVFSFPIIVAHVFRRSLSGSRLLILIYIVYCLLLTLFYPIFSDFGDYLTAIIGFMNLSILVIFWYVVFSKNTIERNLKYFGKIIIFIGFLNAVGAILQFSFSTNLFGLIEHGVYTDENMLANDNVTKRAVSFVVSPQSLSLFLAFCFSLSFVVRTKFTLIYRVLMLVAGVMTVSKVFFLYLSMFFFFSYLSTRRFLSLISFFFALVFVVYLFREHLARVVDVVFYLQNIESYSAYVIWRDSISYGLQFPNFIFGSGIGVFSRGGQEFGNYVLLHGSTESFFIQVFVELGVVGLLIFTTLIFNSLYKYYFFEKKLFASFFAFVCVGFFTPAIYGYTVGIVFYFALLLPLASSRR